MPSEFTTLSQKPIGRLDVTISAFSSQVLGPLLGNARVNALLDDAALVASMVEVEAALARAEARVGVIPAEAGTAIDRALGSYQPDLETIGLRTADSGVATIELVRQLRAHVGGTAGAFVHFGATSQDIIDTAFVLRLRAILSLLESSLRACLAGLAEQAERHRETPLAGRTRFQQALPTSFGLKVAGWMGPLIRNLQRLDELRPRVLAVSFGGAGGTLASLGDQGLAVEAALAEELDLSVPTGIWHTQRDGMGDLAGWLSLVTGACGKVGQDVLLLAQNEVAELRETGVAGRGGSSTLPQKANPISSEVLVSAARMNAGLVANVHQAMLQEHERGGPGWQVEWMCLPQMLACAGGALSHMERLASEMSVQAESMARNLENAQGLLLAEAASFRLAEFMPKPDAQALVKEACLRCIENGQHLVDELMNCVDHPVDWPALRDPRNYLGEASGLIDRTLAAARPHLSEPE